MNSRPQVTMQADCPNPLATLRWTTMVSKVQTSSPTNKPVTAHPSKAMVTQRVELGATGSYTMRPPRPCYELDETGARFPARTLWRTNHTPLGQSTPTRGRNWRRQPEWLAGRGATGGHSGRLLEDDMICVSLLG
jgi:hypothetical protein